jgi:hypothetical protein
MRTLFVLIGLVNDFGHVLSNFLSCQYLGAVRLAKQFEAPVIFFMDVFRKPDKNLFRMRGIFEQGLERLGTPLPV